LVAELRSAGRLHTTTVVSLGRSFETGARRRVAEFRATVRQLAGPTDPARTTDYRPDRVAVLATGAWFVRGVSRIPERQWPNGDLLTGVRTELGECTIRSGAGVPGLEALGRGTPLGTGWLSGAKWSGGVVVLVRPLLPNEDDCADLNRRRPGSPLGWPDGLPG
jgi:hypothetical protein